MIKQPSCSATVYGPRVSSWQCHRSGVIERDGKLYCRQHDPNAKATRDKNREGAWSRKRADEAAIDAEGQRLAKVLGVPADVYYHTLGPFRNHGSCRKLVIDFDDCLKLAERLRRKP